MSERVAIIRNSYAGQGKSNLVERIAEKLRRGGQHVRMLNTEYPGHATELATKIAATGEADVIVAAGGDGTIREVAEGAYGHMVPVGIIPAGSANVLARELGYLKGGRISARHVSNALLSRDIVDLYPFEVERAGRIQLGLCWVGVGFDAEVLRQVSPTLKEKIGRASFVPAIVRALVGDADLPDITWQMHKNTKGVCGWALLANIRRYAGPFTVTKKTDYNVHGLACLMSQGHGAWPRILDQLSIGMGLLDRRCDSWVLERATLHLGDDQTPVQMDGDFIGFGAVEVTPKKHPLPFRAFVRR